VLLANMRVADIAMSLSVSRTGSAKAGAAVKVLDAKGLPVAGATVAGSWSGLSTSSSSVITDTTGVARFSSGSSRATTGSFTFTVNNVTRSGYTYVPLSNTETRDTIAR